jgi:hypothetical protein
MEMMFASVSGAPSAARMASDQASWFVPFGVTFPGSAAGVRPEAAVAVELGASVGLGVLGLGVALAVDGAAVGVADGFGLAGAFLTGADAIGLPIAMCGAKVAITALDSLRLSWRCWLWASGAAAVALVVWAVRGIGMAPTPTATATATRAAANTAAVMTRKDAAGRAPRSLAGMRS